MCESGKDAPTKFATEAWFVALSSSRIDRLPPHDVRRPRHRLGRGEAHRLGELLAVGEVAHRQEELEVGRLGSQRFIHNQFTSHTCVLPVCQSLETSSQGLACRRTLACAGWRRRRSESRPGEGRARGGAMGVRMHEEPIAR